MRTSETPDLDVLVVQVAHGPVEALQVGLLEDLEPVLLDELAALVDRVLDLVEAGGLRQVAGGAGLDRLEALLVGMIARPSVRSQYRTLKRNRSRTSSTSNHANVHIRQLRYLWKIDGNVHRSC